MTNGSNPHRLMIRMTDGSTIIKDYPDKITAGAIVRRFYGDPGKISVLKFSNNDGILFHVNPNNIVIIGVVRPITNDLVERYTLIEPKR